MSASSRSMSARFRRYLVTGIITMIPVWVTWVVFQLVLEQLSKFGLPGVRAVGRWLSSDFPSLSRWVLAPWFQFTVAVLLTIAFLCILGWMAQRVLGQRLIGLFDRAMQRIPFITNVYGLMKKFIATLQQRPERLQRVVLVPFPTPELRAIAFVTKVIRDQNTGQDLVAVFVPTSPNPTSGYLEIVRKENVVETDWTVEQAMTFVVSGGTVAPEQVPFDRPQRT